MGERLDKQVTIIFHITSNCNLRCTYCYQQHCDTKQIIKLEDAKKVIDCLIDRKLSKSTPFDALVCDDFDNVILNFIGGEVTLYMSIVNDICDYFFRQCLEHKFYDLVSRSRITIDTNGTTYFNTDVQDFIHKYKDKLLFAITIDGPRECFDKCRRDKNGNSVFDKVEKAVKQHFVDFGCETTTKLTFAPDNIQYFFESCKYLASLGFTHLKHSIDVNYIPDDKFLKEYRQQLLKTIEWIKVTHAPLTLSALEVEYTKNLQICTCGLATKAGFAIDWNGDIYVCFRFCEDSQGAKKIPIGNINTGISNTAFLEQMQCRNFNNYKKECFDCECSSACSVCPADSYYMCGDINKPFQRCALTKLEAEMSKIYKAKLGK